MNVLWTAMGIAGAAVSFYLNVTFGLTYALFFAIAFGLADLGFFSVSLVVRQAETKDRIRLRLMQIVFLSMSAIAASAHMIQYLKQGSYDAASLTETIEKARLAEKDARDELARITESGTVATLKEQLDSAKATAKAAEAKAASDGVTCIQQTKCRDATAKRDSLLARLGAAQRRDELTTKRDSAVEKVTGTPKQAVGILELAQALGASERQGNLVVLIGVLLTLILCSSMAEQAGEMWAKTFAQRRAWLDQKAGKPVVQMAERVEPKPQATPVLLTPPSEPQSLEDRCFWIIDTMILHSEEQTMRASFSELAAHLTEKTGEEIKLSTLKDWALRWRAAGKLYYFSRGNTSIWQPRRAA